MTPRLVYVGLTHQTAPLSIRENVRADVEKQRTMLSRLGEVAGGRVVLCTCERFEIYATKPRIESADWAMLLSQWFHVRAGLLDAHLVRRSEVDAADHLLRVAAGLESRIVGEAQILGQVRDAFAAAQSMNALDAELSALGRAAVRTGKRVRTETRLGAASPSVAKIALDALQREIGDTTRLTLTVMGTGRLAEVVLEEIRHRGAERCVVVGRDLERLTELGTRFGTDAQPMRRAASVIDGSDAVFVCTAARSYVVDATVLPTARVRPLRVFDLSVPRNVDPMVARVPGVRLTHLDELVEPDDRAAGAIRVVSAPRSDRPVASAPGSDGDAALRVVADELERFHTWQRDRRVAPQIARLLADTDDRTLLHERIMRLKAEAPS